MSGHMIDIIFPGISPDFPENPGNLKNVGFWKRRRPNRPFFDAFEVLVYTNYLPETSSVVMSPRAKMKGILVFMTLSSFSHSQEPYIFHDLTTFHDSREGLEDFQSWWEIKMCMGKALYTMFWEVVSSFTILMFH